MNKIDRLKCNKDVWHTAAYKMWTIACDRSSPNIYSFNSIIIQIIPIIIIYWLINNIKIFYYSVWWQKKVELLFFNETLHNEIQRLNNSINLMIMQIISIVISSILFIDQYLIIRSFYFPIKFNEIFIFI